jgi:hypothetical protein
MMLPVSGVQRQGSTSDGIDPSRRRLLARIRQQVVATRAIRDDKPYGKPDRRCVKLASSIAPGGQGLPLRLFPLLEG